MTDILLLLALVVALAAVIMSAAIWTAVWLWRWRRPFGPAALLLFAWAVGVNVYQAIVPPESFYRQEFERNARVPFPPSGRIVARSASFPDHFGDYCAAALFEVDAADWATLQVATEAEDHRPRVSFGSSCVNAVATQIGGRVAVISGPQEMVEGGRFFEWGPIDGERRLMFQLVTW